MIVCVEELDEEMIRTWLTRDRGENDPRAQRVEFALQVA